MAKQRGHGDGALFFSESRGRWRARGNITDALGVARRREVSGATKEEARQALRELTTAKTTGTLTRDPVKQTVGDWVTYWLLHVVKARRAVNTHTCYEDTYVRYIQPHMADAPLTGVQPVHVQELLGKLSTAGHGYRVLQLVRTVLNGALKLAASDAWKLIPTNPVAGVVAPSTPQRAKHVVWSVDEQRKFMAAVADDPMHALYALALTTGMRQGEILGLQWADVDLPGGTITVRHNLVERRGRLVGLFAPKTTAGLRTFRLTKYAVNALRQHRATLLARGLAAAPQVFAVRPTALRAARSADEAPFQGYWLKSNLYAAYQALIAKTGVTRITFHDLRHTFATQAIADGAPIAAVSQQLGHAKVSTTSDIYVGVTTAMSDAVHASAERTFPAT